MDSLRLGIILAMSQVMRIGLDIIGLGESGGVGSIPGEMELCVMAIGVQPIGRVVGRDARTGRFSSLTRVMAYGRRVVGWYSEVEIVELESRPNPRASRATSVSGASTVAARAVITLALVVLVTRASWTHAASAAVLGLAADATGAVVHATVDGARRLARWAAEYVRREFLAQWRLGLATLVPCAAILAWVALAAR